VKVLVSAFQCAAGHGSEPGHGWSWATALADYGHDVTVLTYPEFPEFRERMLAGERSDIDFHFVEYPGRPIPVFPIDGYDEYRRWQQAAYDYVVALDRKFDVVHHVTWGSLHFGSRLYQLPVPLVYGPIGGGQTAPKQYKRYFGRGWPMEVVRNASTGPLLNLNRWTRNTLQNAAVTLVTNWATEAACRRLGARDVRYFLDSGLPQEWVSSPRRRPAGVPVIFWAGRMLPRKAPVLAVHAFAELCKTTPARLVMAGEGPLAQQVEDTVQRLGIGGDVDLLGQVPWDEMTRQYDTAAVLLFTSLRESFGAQLLEAMGRGLPVVALDMHGISDAKVGLAAEKVPLPGNPDELPARLAAGMRAVLSGSDWEARSAAAVQFASEHTFPAKAARATQIYEEVTGR
jgi:glycosyltransferase involved in cell wall biosynthesis